MRRRFRRNLLRHAAACSRLETRFRTRRRFRTNRLIRRSRLRDSPLRRIALQGSPLQGSPLQGSPLQGSPLQGSPLQGKLLRLSRGKRLPRPNRPTMRHLTPPPFMGARPRPPNRSKMTTLPFRLYAADEELPAEELPEEVAELRPPSKQTSASCSARPATVASVIPVDENNEEDLFAAIVSQPKRPTGAAEPATLASPRRAKSKNKTGWIIGGCIAGFLLVGLGLAYAAGLSTDRRRSPMCRRRPARPSWFSIGPKTIAAAAFSFSTTTRIRSRIRSGRWSTT